MWLACDKAARQHQVYCSLSGRERGREREGEREGGRKRGVEREKERERGGEREEAHKESRDMDIQPQFRQWNRMKAMKGPKDGVKEGGQ